MREDERTHFECKLEAETITIAHMQILNGISKFILTCLLSHFACCRMPSLNVEHE